MQDNASQIWESKQAQQLVEALLSISDPKTMQNFLRDVMTEKEIMANNTVPVYTLQGRQYLYKLFQGYNSRKFSGFTNIKKWYFDNNIQKSDNLSPFAIFYEYLDWVLTTAFIRNNY